MCQEYYVNRMLVVGVPRNARKHMAPTPFSIPSTFTNNFNFNWLKWWRSQGKTLMLSFPAYHDEGVKSLHLLSHMQIPLFWVKI